MVIPKKKQEVFLKKFIVSFSGSFDKQKKGKYFNYLLELDIPCISFKDYVYPIDSSLNTVDYHVKILKESKIEENLYYFAAHSGNGRYSYFNHLVDVKIGDVIILNFFDHKLYYIVSDIYLIDKMGYMISNEFADTLYLITCSLENKKKQLIIQASLT